LYNSLHECLLFLPDLEVGERLNDRDPTPTGGPPSRSWFQFGFPMGYVQDVLRNLEVLTALGHGRDARLRHAAEGLLESRGPDGRWTMHYSYRGKLWCDVEGKGKPSKWVTLRARRVLKRTGVMV